MPNRTRLVSGGQKQITPKAYPIGTRPGKSAPGIAYDTGKTISKYFGYYKEIEPFLPENIVPRYLKKPYKEPVTTSIEFARLQKKIFKKTKTSYNKFNYTSSRCVSWNNNGKSGIRCS